MLLFTATRCVLGKSVQVKLPKRNMVIDPRPNNQRQRTQEHFTCSLFLKFNRFECVYHVDGTTVTLTRVVDEVFEAYENDEAVALNRAVEQDYYDGPFQFRVYDPSIERVPSFNSTTYKYLGISGEKAPPDTTVLIIDPMVRIIEREAFSGCDKIEKCIMHDRVESIGFWAFARCSAMKVIKLSRSLKHIGPQAFESCTSLEAIILPPSLEEIDSAAFLCCENLRILTLPFNINTVEIRPYVIEMCNTLLDLTQTPEYVYAEDVGDIINSDEVHQYIIDFYRNLPPLHRVCLDNKVTSQAIKDCVDAHGSDTVYIRDHDGMTPLHILAINPHSNIGAIGACFCKNKHAVFTRDSRGKTPLDYLRVHHEIENHTFLMVALCVHREMMME